MSVEVEIDGKHYRQRGSSWYETETHRTPSPREQQWLTRRLQQQEVVASAAVPEAGDVVARKLAQARRISQQGNHEYVLELVNEVLAQQPDHPGALALLCTTLTALGSPTQGLLRTDAWQASCDGELLLARADALCALQLWGEAKVLAQRALAMGESDGAHQVLNSVHEARPDLFTAESATA
jgi:hypothetical protein